MPDVEDNKGSDILIGHKVQDDLLMGHCNVYNKDIAAKRI